MDLGFAVPWVQLLARAWGAGHCPVLCSLYSIAVGALSAFLCLLLDVLCGGCLFSGGRGPLCSHPSSYRVCLHLRNNFIIIVICTHIHIHFAVVVVFMLFMIFTVCLPASSPDDCLLCFQLEVVDVFCISMGGAAGCGIFFCA